jgi:hypothetical protein
MSSSISGFTAWGASGVGFWGVGKDRAVTEQVVSKPVKNTLRQQRGTMEVKALMDERYQFFNLRQELFLTQNSSWGKVIYLAPASL